MAAVCPECDNPLVVEADDMERGETMQCDECGAELEVVATDPLELASMDEARYDEEEAAAPVLEDEE